MKRRWTRSEKWLWATPLLFGFIAFVISQRPDIQGPNLIRRIVGRPQQLGTTSTNMLQSIVLSRDGSVLATTGRDSHPKIAPSSGTVYLWDARTLLPLKPFTPQRWKSAQGMQGWIVDSLSLSPDGKLIGISKRGASGYAVYEVATQKLLWHATTYTQNAEFSSDGRFVALGQFELREARTGKVIARWNAENGSMIQHFSLSPDGQTVAWIGEQHSRPPAKIQNFETADAPDSKAVEIRRVSDGKVLYTLPESQETESVAFSPDGSRIVSLSSEKLTSSDGRTSMVRCHLTNGKLLWQRDFRHSDPKYIDHRIFCDAVFSPDGRSIALREVGPENGVLILDASIGNIKQQLVPTSGQETNYLPPHAIAFSPDGKGLYARGADAILVWDLQ